MVSPERCLLGVGVMVRPNCIHGLELQQSGGELRRARPEATDTGEVHLASGRISAPQGLGLLFVSSRLSHTWNMTWPEAGAKQTSVTE